MSGKTLKALSWNVREELEGGGIYILKGFIEAGNEDNHIVYGRE